MMPRCLLPHVSVHKLTKKEVNDLTQSENRKKNVKAFINNERKSSRNGSFDKNRKKRHQEAHKDNIKKIKSFQKFLECASGELDMSILRDEIAILKTEFDPINDIDRDNCSVASSSFSEFSRPRRKISAPERFSVAAKSPLRQKIKKNEESSMFFDPNELFEVETIKNMNLINNQVYFLVKWKDYPENTNTWESFENVCECEALEKFLAYELEGKEDDIKRECDQLLNDQQEEIKIYLAKPKSVIMNELKSFDPLEFKCYQIIYVLIKNNKIHYQSFRKSFRKMIILNYFHEKDIEQYEEYKKIIDSIREKERNVFSVSIKNDVDFDVFKRFDYVHENIWPQDVVIQEQAAGCKCENGCNRESNCCPTKTKNNFAYKSLRGKKRLRLVNPQMIVECNDNCRCGKDCLNRVTQQPRLIPLRIFKTSNGRGWGLKTMASIPTGSFIIEYTGEVIDQDESLCRGKLYDEIGQSYLFDLDYNERSDAVYTIDAYRCGNLSRLINHSCEPNLEIWPVTTCGQNPLIYRLCFFSNRFIKEGEELSFDYTGGTVESVKMNVEEGDSLVSGNHIARRYDNKDSCKCGSELCRGLIFNRQVTELVASSVID